MNKIWTIGSVLTWTQKFFQQKGIETPRLDAEILLAHVLGKERIYLYAHYEEPLNGEELAQYRAFIQKRADAYAVAHITGVKAFFGSDFLVSLEVLIPRPETELLVEYVIHACKQRESLRILDIGTGSGAILLSLLAHLPQAVGWGVDISRAALQIAEKNSIVQGLETRAVWRESDLCQQVQGERFSVIVSNPPYLTAADMAQLQPEIRREPETALFGGQDGLDIYRRLAVETVPLLEPGGLCAVEIGRGQEEAVQRLFTADGDYTLQDCVWDYGRILRHLVFKKERKNED